MRNRQIQVSSHRGERLELIKSETLCNDVSISFNSRSLSYQTTKPPLPICLRPAELHEPLTELPLV